ncbi:hypothetical protein BDV95DRAFT_168247 [Massariosphaeria phaeospora]|uniref:Uncharacterized protein n=1 Tax=Massariosphaeria phaeospora TaxID=100035 RepID=A0A7C8M4G2_9PLEO|nr:hypothetical protein BDV95DRAFT_168247 [Massariosphaeria phaeospora]
MLSLSRMVLCSPAALLQCGPGDHIRPKSNALGGVTLYVDRSRHQMKVGSLCWHRDIGAIFTVHDRDMMVVEQQHLSPISFMYKHISLSS